MTSMWRRTTALVLSWVMPATSTWALAPAIPPPPIAHGVVFPAPYVLPTWGGEASTRELGSPSTAVAASESWVEDVHPPGDHHHHAGCDHPHDRPGEFDDADDD